jgi:hypothetical protein
MALSIAKALTTGKRCFGHFEVPEIRPVLHLCPEVNDRQFRRRAQYFGIPDNENLFLCRTMIKGTMLTLDHAYILEAIRQLHEPVVILDTAIRFSKAKDESSATENRWMEQNTRILREAGAIAVICFTMPPRGAQKMRFLLSKTVSVALAILERC